MSKSSVFHVGSKRVEWRWLEWGELSLGARLFVWLLVAAAICMVAWILATIKLEAAPWDKPRVLTVRVIERKQYGHNGVAVDGYGFSPVWLRTCDSYPPLFPWRPRMGSCHEVQVMGKCMIEAVEVVCADFGLQEVE